MPYTVLGAGNRAMNKKLLPSLNAVRESQTSNMLSWSGPGKCHTENKAKYEGSGGCRVLFYREQSGIKVVRKPALQIKSIIKAVSQRALRQEQKQRASMAEAPRRAGQSRRAV